MNSKNVTCGANRASLAEGGSGICSRSIQSGETSIEVPLKRENRFTSTWGFACDDRELSSTPRSGDGGLFHDVCAATPGTRNPNRTILTIPHRVISTVLVSVAITWDNTMDRWPISGKTEAYRKLQIEAVPVKLLHRDPTSSGTP